MQLRMGTRWAMPPSPSHTHGHDWYRQKVKVGYLLILWRFLHESDWRPEALYNLGSGRWLARANDTVRIIDGRPTCNVWIELWRRLKTAAGAAAVHDKWICQNCPKLSPESPVQPFQLSSVANCRELINNVCGFIAIILALINTSSGLFWSTVCHKFQCQSFNSGA